jgi:protein O-GlcNAc transferase
MHTETTEKKAPLLQFKHVEVGTPQLVITADIPDFVRQAYGAAEAGDMDRVRLLLAQCDTDTLAAHLTTQAYHVQVVFLLGLIYARIEAWESAETCFTQVLQGVPHAMVYHELNRICMLTGRLKQARDYRQQAYALSSDNPILCCNHATDLFRLGQMQEGIKVFWQAANAAPHNARIGSRYLNALSYLAEHCQENLKAAHRRWALAHTSPALAAPAPDHDFTGSRSLRVGYLLGDLCRRTVGYGIDALLEGHDRYRFESFAYTDGRILDEVCPLVQPCFKACHDIAELDDQNVAQRIKDDRIDILVAVGGHSFLSRLRVLAYQPAPIQLEYGAFCPTPMDQINYRLEEWFEPSGDQAEVAVPPLLCFKPDSVFPGVGPLPALANDCVTFGCFNTSYKMTAHMLSVWARILDRVENSRLLLKFRGGYDTQQRRACLARFEQWGIAPQRIEMHGWQRYTEHLELLTQADIALDTYPNNGRTTLLEALWMGVPFVTRTDPNSDLFMSRRGQALLNTVELACLACSSDEQYIEAAVLLSQKRDGLSLIRSSLRQRLTIPGGLCDARVFALRMEKAYRRMWEHECRTRQNHTTSPSDITA